MVRFALKLLIRKCLSSNVVKPFSSKSSSSPRPISSTLNSAFSFVVCVKSPNSLWKRPGVMDTTSSSVLHRCKYEEYTSLMQSGSHSYNKVSKFAKFKFWFLFCFTFWNGVTVAFVSAKVLWSSMHHLYPLTIWKLSRISKELNLPTKFYTMANNDVMTWSLGGELNQTRRWNAKRLFASTTVIPSASFFSSWLPAPLGTNKETFTAEWFERWIASSMFIVNNPPADESHSPPRRITCNTGSLVSEQQAYKNNRNKSEQLGDTKTKRHGRLSNCQLLIHNF